MRKPHLLWQVRGKERVLRTHLATLATTALTTAPAQPSAVVPSAITEIRYTRGSVSLTAKGGSLFCMKFLDIQYGERRTFGNRYREVSYIV